MAVKIKKIKDNAITPTYATEFSAGADLYSAQEATIILPHQTVVISTGITLEIPENLVGLIYARSGLAVKKGLAPANKVGVIDSDYRGEILVALHNHGNAEQTVNPGDRIAQIIFTPFINATFEEVDCLNHTVRGDGGFGSTGK